MAWRKPRQRTPGLAVHIPVRRKCQEEPVQQPRHALWGTGPQGGGGCRGAVTWRDLADGGRVPAVALVTVGGLHEDSAVTEALCEDLPSDVVQPHAPP